MEIIEQAISILSGTIGLGAGLYAFRTRAKARALPQPAAKKSEKLTSFVDDTALAEVRQPRGLGPAFYIGAAAFLIPALIAAFSYDPAALFWLGISAFYLYMARATGKERSSTFRSTTFTIQSRKEDVMHRGHEVLKGMGLRIVAFDVDAGLIEARRAANLRTLGELITVMVYEGGAGEASVTIESDSSFTATRFDFGANQRNVDQFVDGLTSGSI